jgi:hypothetical protein
MTLLLALPVEADGERSVIKKSALESRIRADRSTESLVDECKIDIGQNSEQYPGPEFPGAQRSVPDICKHIVGRDKEPDEIGRNKERHKERDDMRSHCSENWMAGEPHCASLNESRQIGEYGLGTRPAAPDAAIQNREEHDADEEEEKYEQNEISFTDPDDGAEEVELERWDIKTKGAFTLNSQEGQTKHQHSLQPCSYPAFDAIGCWYHA